MQHRYIYMAIRAPYIFLAAYQFSSHFNPPVFKFFFLHQKRIIFLIKFKLTGLLKKPATAKWDCQQVINTQQKTQHKKNQGVKHRKKKHKKLSTAPQAIEKQRNKQKNKKNRKKHQGKNQGLRPECPARPRQQREHEHKNIKLKY